jgi:hypothetical protein
MAKKIYAGATIWLALAGSAPGEKVVFETWEKFAIEANLRKVVPDNAAREKTLHDLFEQVGCSSDRLAEQKIKGSKVPNLVCTLAGGERVIVVGAHSDAEGGDGVIDNWSGASLLPALYRSLKGGSRRHTFAFVGFSGEEKGLLGSKFYLGHLPREDRGKISAMVNLDSLGLGPAVIWLSRADKDLARAASQAAMARGGRLGSVDVEQVGTTDSETFRDAKIPAITFHSVTQETWKVINGSGDRWAAVKLDDYYESYCLLALYLAYLDIKLDAAPTAVSAGQ